jgi:hypothetical protein
MYYHTTLQDPTLTAINATFTLGLYGCHVGIIDGMELRSAKLSVLFWAQCRDEV